MSVRYVTQAIDEKSISGNDKIVLITLADHADDEGYCFPGQEHLASRLGLSKRTIVNVMARLEEAGLIERTRRYREIDGLRTSDSYHLFPGSGATSAPRGQVQLSEGQVQAVAPTKEPSVRTPSREKKRETELPTDWAPTEEHRERARKEGLDLNKQVELFRLHAETHGRVAKSWNAAFTTWLIKAIDMPAAQRPGWRPPPEPPRKIHDSRYDGPLDTYRGEH